MEGRESFHMTPEEFRKWGHAVVDWVASYQERINQPNTSTSTGAQPPLPVLSQVKPNEVLAKMPKEFPAKANPAAMEDMLRDMNEIVMPGITHWQSPNFFAYFPANSSGPAVLGDLLSSGLAVQGMLWATSPACTEVEIAVLDWIVDMLGLPASFKHSSGVGGGVLQDTASSCALTALCCARELASNFASLETGLCGGPKLVAYCSEHAHSSIDKAMMISGLGRANLRKIKADPVTHAMLAEELEKAIKQDLAQGLVPCFVNAVIGSTSTNAVDPVRAIGEIAKRYKLWLHVDAAMCGTAAMCPEFRWINDGVELANSYCFNPHKWMFTNFDCSCFFVTDREVLTHTMSILPEYLRNKATDSHSVVDFRDWHIPLGRRFRSLKLWSVLRHYGHEGLQHHIREHVKLAQEFAQRVRDSERFELVCEPPLNLVCFRLNRAKYNDNANQILMDRLNNSGKMMLSHSKIDGAFVLRLCVGSVNTTREHVDAAWNQLTQQSEGLEH